MKRTQLAQSTNNNYDQITLYLNWMEFMGLISYEGVFRPDVKITKWGIKKYYESLKLGYRPDTV